MRTFSCSSNLNSIWKERETVSWCLANSTGGRRISLLSTSVAITRTNLVRFLHVKWALFRRTHFRWSEGKEARRNRGEPVFFFRILTERRESRDKYCERESRGEDETGKWN